MKEDDQFDHRTVDAKWQKRWLKSQRYKTPDSPQDKAYVLDMFPYPSGEGLHVGHPLGYIGTDIVARYLRARGKAVLHPIGFDAFGLPAENYAIKTGIHPAETTQKAIERYRKQLKMIGLSYDWDREISTADPSYYRWTQWLFLKLLEKGLAYRAKAPVNWCPQCQTVLANEQVKDGKCERCDTPVQQKELAQWFFKITAYADELLTDVDSLDWPEPIKVMQRNWIGRSEGSLLRFAVKSQKLKFIEVFTTRPDTLYGATYLVLAPEHPFVTEQIQNPNSEIRNIKEVKKYVKQAEYKSELERKAEDKDKTGVELSGISAIHPATKKEIPIWVARYVLASYGTGAIMAVPAHDERDFAFAKKHGLPVRSVVEPLVKQSSGSSAFRDDEPVIDAHEIIILLKHWSADTYLGLKWRKPADWSTLLIGDIDDDLDPKAQILQEIYKETGYKNAKIIRKLGVIHSKYYHVLKKNNRFGHGLVFLVHLENSKQDKVSTEIGDRRELRWLSLSELRDFLTVISHKTAVNLLEQGVYTGPGLLTNSAEFTGMDSEQAKQKITQSVNGNMTTTYRLRDWLVSRQRYWGAPIPMVICKQHSYQPVPEDQLPVLLPTDVDFKPTGQSPLVDSKAFHAGVTCPKCGKPARREVDTLDTFVDSSWYFLRYTDPNNNQAAFDPKKVRQWLPVDWYVGGAEHAVLHLLYARFITKALADLRLLHFREPFTRLRNQGLIGGEDGRKMSKRWGNVVNPDDVVRDYGADALRAFEMFMGPFEDAKPWSTQGIVGVRRWLERVWRLATRYKNHASRIKEETERILHQSIQKVTEDIENFRFNTAVSQLMILTNALEKETVISADAWRSFLQILSPFVPHIAYELWERAGFSGYPDNSWPVADPEKLKEKTVTLAIQVNGKLRGQIEVSSKASEETITQAAKALDSVQKHLVGKTIHKTIVIPGRIVNFVVK